MSHTYELGFKQVIREDTDLKNNLFLVAEVDERIVGFSRCAGSLLKRTSHKVEFGVCVLKEYWGYRIGQNLLTESLRWADLNGIKKNSPTIIFSRFRIKNNDHNKDRCFSVYESNTYSLK